MRLLLAVRLGTRQAHGSDAYCAVTGGTSYAFTLEFMMASRVISLLVFVAGALGGCVTDVHDGDPDLDVGDDSATRRRPRPAPEPTPDPAPDPGCTLVGGPSTLGATLDGFDYVVTGGPTGNGNGTSIRMAQSGFVTVQTTQRGTVQGWLDGLTLYGLFRKATSAELPTLCASYSCTACADDYVHNLTILFNGVPYTVRTGFRASPPERLTTLINAVQDITTRPLL